MAETIGTRILQLRGKQTQQQLADAIGVSRELVKAWECNDRKVKSEDVVKLAKYFGVPTDWLLCMEGSVPCLDIDTQSVCKLLGITEDSLSALEALSKAFPNIINDLIQSPRFMILVQALSLLRHECFNAAIHSDSLKGILDLNQQDLEEIEKLPKRSYIQYRNELRNCAYDVVEYATGLADDLTAYRTIMEAVETEAIESRLKYSQIISGAEGEKIDGKH